MHVYWVIERLMVMLHLNAHDPLYRQLHCSTLAISNAKTRAVLGACLHLASLCIHMDTARSDDVV
jgi:hypothetical protein